MLNNILSIEGASLLPKEVQKTINGGNPSGCGVKVGGIWYPALDSNGNGNTIEDAAGSLGTNVDYTLSNNVVVNGFVTNWCCDSCPWNSVQ